MARVALVTGSAGFIGFHLSRRLLSEGWQVVGIDAMTPYYDVRLKHARHAELGRHPAFRAVEAAIEEPGRMSSLMAEVRPDAVIHLAAQAGVRYSIDAPRSYVEANLVGTFEVLEAARATPPAHLLLASTSSVYGANTEMPYREADKADTPLSFYAATKKATEAMAHSYAHLYGVPTTLFRFFTVYGPWGRPDMALFKFVSAIREGRPIDIYNHGRMKRDFTYIDDLVDAIARLIPVAPPGAGGREAWEPLPGDSLSAVAPWRVLNIGNDKPVELTAFVAAIEEATGQIAQKNMLPIQPGDVPATWADTTLLHALIGPTASTPLSDGIKAFVAWFDKVYLPMCNSDEAGSGARSA